MNSETVVLRPHWSETLASPLRTFHTIRHLHAAQVVDRAVRALRRSSARVAVIEDEVRLHDRTAVQPAVSVAGAFDGRSFSFLNRRIAWGGPDRWYPAGADALWIYNLHYFRFLWSMPQATACELVSDWIQANPPSRNLGWDAYPISLRLREWVEWLLAHPDLDPAFRQTMASSIAQQTEVLAERLEYHLMGNHLLENAITLCWVGLSLDGRRGGEWLKTGMRVLRRELARQVLADGSHDERSPMYQAILAEALLRLAEVAGPLSRARNGAAFDVCRLARQAGQQMLGSLGHLVHPDGHYALLNDAALGVAPSLDSLVRRFGRTAEPPGTGSWSLDEAGYLGYRDRDGRYLAFDAGPLGPDHQPGHGHADALSFELSHRGQRLVTDTGVFTYVPGSERCYDRSTAAHNTVEIDGRNQSELWGAFRCARRPSQYEASASVERTGVTLAGSYLGPGRGVRGVRHARQIFISSRVLAFSDTLAASGQRRATVRLHFAPGLGLTSRDGAWIVAAGAGKALARIASDGLEWRQTTSPYHPEFGREVERASLVADVSFRDHVTLKWWFIL